MKSESTDEYVESLYKLGNEGTPATLKRLATDLRLSPGAVCEKVRKLIKEGLASQDRKKEITLTTEGNMRAIDIIRKHRLAEKFLVDVLGIPWDEVHEDACRFEHILSDRVADALEEFLKHPAYCPHGHPIPDRHGIIKQEKHLKLSELSSDDSAEVMKVAEHSPGLLQYLATLGLIPHARIHIDQVAPFNGAFLVKIGGACYALGKEIADNIWVRKIEEKAGA
ncbi:MAG: metal-dependent transcriptional regulator [Candidatus Eremiobacteraeota bacterium]|nr:metal-dependent transcriptional regulator [Candidatus Eremiobacteraeota bacterium]